MGILRLPRHCLAKRLIYFGLVQPASVRGSVVNRQAAPEIAAVLLSEASARSMSDAVSASFRKP